MIPTRFRVRKRTKIPMCDQVTAKRKFSKRHAHGIMARSPVDIRRVDSITSNSKKRKVSVDVFGESITNFLMYSKGKDGTSDEETSESVPSVVPSIVCVSRLIVYTEGNPDSAALMMVTRNESSLLELVRNRPSGREATERLIQDIVGLHMHTVVPSEKMNTVIGPNATRTILRTVGAASSYELRNRRND